MIASVKDFLVAHWGVIVAYLAIGTLLVRTFDFAATKFPVLQPAARVVDSLFHDVIEIITALAKLIGQPFQSPPSSTSSVLLVFLLFGVVGCAGTFEEAGKPRVALGPTAPAPDPATCSSLDAQHRNWSASAVGAMLLSGTAGIVSIPVPSSDNGARIGLVSGAVAAAAWGAVSEVEASGTATSYIADGCGP